MRVEQIVRAWKDEGYRRGLTAEERSLLPESPAGLVEVPEGELDNVAGAGPTVVPIEYNTLSLACTADVALSISLGGTCQCGTLGCCKMG